MESTIVPFKKLKPFVPLQVQKRQELEQVCKSKNLDKIKTHIANIKNEYKYRIKYCLKHGFDDYVEWRYQESKQLTCNLLSKQEIKVIVYYAHRYSRHNLQYMIKDDAEDYWKRALYGACKAGDTHTVKRIFSEHKDTIIQDKNELPDNNIIEKALCYAAASGSEKVLSYLSGYCINKNLERQELGSEPIENMCKYSHLYGDNVKYAIDLLQEHIYFYWNFIVNRSFYTTAKRKGAYQIQTLEFLASIAEPNWNDALEGACEDGNTELIEYIQSKAKNIAIPNKQENRNEKVTKKPYVLDWKQAFEGACRGGQLRILRYLIQMKLVHSCMQDKEWLRKCFQDANKKGHLEIVEYLYKKYLFKTISMDKEIVCDAIKSGNLDLVKYLVSLFKTWSNNDSLFYLERSCSCDKKMFDYFLSLIKQDSVDIGWPHYASYACAERDLSILHYCLEEMKKQEAHLYLYDKLLRVVVQEDLPYAIRLLLKCGASNINQVFKIAIEEKQNRVLKFFSRSIGKIFCIQEMPQEMSKC
jgi:hypothetical protein